MQEALQQTRSVLASTHDSRARVETRVAGFRLASVVLLAATGALAADVVVPLPSFIRGAALLAVLATACFATFRSVRRRGSTTTQLAQAARLIETLHPELDSALINALQFDSAVVGSTDSAEAALMRREIARAEDAAHAIAPESIVDPAPAVRSRNRFAIYAVFVLLSTLFLGRVWRFEAPRFLLFWQDHPPFTLTDFTITPGDAHVRMGGSLPINVRVGGLAPESLALVVESGTGERTLPLLAAEDGTYSQSLEGLTENAIYFIRANTGRTRRFAIRVERAPEVRSVSATITPPSYTRKGPATIVVASQPIAALLGSMVEVQVESTRPLAGGVLTLTDGNDGRESIPLTVDRAHPVLASTHLVVRRDALFQIDLRGQDGQERKAAARGRIALIRDEKPLVTITAPGRNVVVPPDMKVAIRIEAEDDHALQRIELHRIVNDMAESARTLPVTDHARKAESGTTIDLKDLGARPGDVIQYYATAYDNGPGTPNLTDSDRYWLWVVSPQDYERILRQQRDLSAMAAEYRALTDRLHSLAGRQRAHADGAALAARNATKSALKSLRREQEEIARDARALADEMRKAARLAPRYDVERALHRKLGELANHAEQAAAGPMKRAEIAENPSSLATESAAAARQLESAAGLSKRSIEKALSAMEKLAPLYEDIRHLQELTKQQADIAIQSRLAANQVRQDAFRQSRMADLAQRQSDVRQMLDSVRAGLDEHAARCEADAPSAARQARQLGLAVDRTGAAGKMDSAAGALRRQQPREGAAQAEAAQRGLERLWQQSRGAQGACRAALDGQLNLCLGQGSENSLQQLSHGLGGAPGQAGGQGLAQGEGNPAPQPGSRPGDGGAAGGAARQAAALTAIQQQAGRSERRENRRHLAAGEGPATLGSQDVERLSGSARPPSPASDAAAGRYPAEYRKLVKDYFRSVAGGAK
jgi:hypothetical protein